MLKKLKTPFPFGKTFCQFGKRWYFCTRFSETERAPCGATRYKEKQRNNVKKQ